MRPRPARPALLALFLSAAVTSLPAQQRDRATLIAAIDSLADAPIKAGRAAGMSVAVVQGADTIRLRGYGSADLELEVPTPDRAVYEIGSVTKQFTAAAVFQLQEQGKLSLDDDLTKFLPNYPTQGHRIPIRRLLNHTSGIKGYTEIPAFWSTLAPRALPRDSLVALFAPQPFDFSPGDAMIYNNSAYFLLGLIIEKAAGQPYEQYVEERLFQPAGMNDSRYCSDQAVVKRRTKGYELSPAAGPDSGVLRRASYLVHVWPYAAGSLCSTARDLVIWARALHGTGQGGRILSRNSYRQFITPDTLNNGARLRYANGLALTETGGRRMISHGGGIYGYVSELRYYPDQDLSIAVLINTAGPASPSRVADAIADLILGQPPEPRTATFAGDLRPLVGTYQGSARGRELAVTVSLDSGSLSVKAAQGEPRRLAYLQALTFANGPTRYHFVRTGADVTELHVDEVAGYYVLRRK
ncbi:MAG: beta-lactamase family protein [Gemmatimonadetes bacterium]|nr:beta-lactamase family protein [Gemmatimonadota bacterium]